MKSQSTGGETGESPGETAARLQRKALLLVNPNSRSGGDTSLEGVIELLEQSGFQVVQQESTSAEQCVKDLDRNCGDADVVIVAGGDGTVSSVAGTLYRHRKPLAIFPLGTANDLARSLAVPSDLEEAGQLIIDNRLREIDLGVVNGHYFLNAVNIGLGTRITHQLTADSKKAWGSLSYIQALWRTIARNHSFRVNISVDGKRFQHRSIHLTIGNGRYYGGGNVVDAEAEIDSGKLCLYSIRPQPLWKLMVLAPLLRLGRQKLARNTFTVSGRHIEISTTRPLEVQPMANALPIHPSC